MNKPAVLKIAGSALVLGATLVGCNPAAKRVANASDAVHVASSDAIGAATKAEKALKARNFAVAIANAEAAVSASPRDASYRLLLGQSYLAGGRFLSAEAALTDALTLDPENSRAALSLVLTQIALGQPGIARETLSAKAHLIAAADQGLALALAGDPHGAIDMLLPAAREEGATAKTRQNLALSYALAGEWGEARAVAAQDVPAEQLDQRLMQWAAMASPRNSWDQVAALLGVKPVLDSGQPQRLALRDAPAAEPQQALAAVDAPEQAFAPTEQELAAAEPQPAPVAEVEAEAQPVSAPAVTALAALKAVVFGPRQEVVQPIPAKAREHAAKQAFAARSTTGKFVVQLGAYSSPARAEAAWKGAVSRYKALAGYAPRGETFRSVHRVAVAGFATHAEAARVCGTLKAKGGACFVRANTGAQQAQWALRLSGNVRLAAR